MAFAAEDLEVLELIGPALREGGDVIELQTLLGSALDTLVAVGLTTPSLLLAADIPTRPD